MIGPGINNAPGIKPGNNPGINPGINSLNPPGCTNLHNLRVLKDSKDFKINVIHGVLETTEEGVGPEGAQGVPPLFISLNKGHKDPIIKGFKSLFMTSNVGQEVFETNDLRFMIPLFMITEEVSDLKDLLSDLHLAPLGSGVDPPEVAPMNLLSEMTDLIGVDSYPLRVSRVRVQ